MSITDGRRLLSSLMSSIHDALDSMLVVRRVSAVGTSVDEGASQPRSTALRVTVTLTMRQPSGDGEEADDFDIGAIVLFDDKALSLMSPIEQVHRITQSVAKEFKKLLSNSPSIDTARGPSRGGVPAARQPRQNARTILCAGDGACVACGRPLPPASGLRRPGEPFVCADVDAETGEALKRYYAQPPKEDEDAAY